MTPEERLTEIKTSLAKAIDLLDNGQDDECRAVLQSAFSRLVDTMNTIQVRAAYD